MIILLQLNDMVKNAGKYFSLFEFVKKSNCPISICLQFHFSDLFSSFKRLKNCKFGFKHLWSIFEHLTWIFSGIWIENLGCINSEKLGRPPPDILAFGFNDKKISPFSESFYTFQFIKEITLILHLFVRSAEIKMRKWSMRIS